MLKINFRFIYKDIPDIANRFSQSGKGFIPYSKQLPRKSSFSLTKTSLRSSNKSHPKAFKNNGRNSTTTNKSEISMLDNIDKLQKSCSRLKLLKLYDHEAKKHLERDSVERSNLNIKLNDVFINPRDRFSSLGILNHSGYILDYQKENDRFPKGVNTMNKNRKSYFDPTPLEKADCLDRAVRGSANVNFKI